MCIIVVLTSFLKVHVQDVQDIHVQDKRLQGKQWSGWMEGETTRGRTWAWSLFVMQPILTSREQHGVSPLGAGAEAVARLLSDLLYNVRGIV